MTKIFYENYYGNGSRIRCNDGFISFSYTKLVSIFLSLVIWIPSLFSALSSFCSIIQKFNAIDRRDETAQRREYTNIPKRIKLPFKMYSYWSVSIFYLIFLLLLYLKIQYDHYNLPFRQAKSIMLTL